MCESKISNEVSLSSLIDVKSQREYRKLVEDGIKELLSQAWDMGYYVTDVTVIKKKTFFGDEELTIKGRAYQRGEVAYREESWNEQD